MVNFSIQINYLVLVFVTVQIVAGNIAKPPNEAHNELKQAGTADMLVTNLRNASGLTEGRDSYSYYYVGRWTWHVPLYFLLWFVFYITFNVFRSISGHQINPDDYLRKRRSIGIYTGHPTMQELNSLSSVAAKSFRKYKKMK